MIKKDISDLPMAERSEGKPPNEGNLIAEQLAHAWFAEYRKDGLDKARAIPELPYRASYASKRCDRQLGYALADVPESEPLTITSAWSMGLGTMVHDRLQQVLTQILPEAECEPDIDLRSIGIPGSGHADVVLRDDDTLIEIKTTGGFAFKMMATSFKGAPQGPRFGYLLQAGMMAKALGLSNVVIAVLSLESVSPQLAESYATTEAGRFAAEWSYTVDELDDDIMAEVHRVRNILDGIEDGVLPDRVLDDPEYPIGATVTAPMAARAPWVVTNDEGNVVDSGQYWGCAYCPWRSKCDADGGGSVQIVSHVSSGSDS